MTRVARAVFVALVVATFAAFFVAQGLKSSPTLVKIVGTAKYFSPNGDGTRDVNDFSVTLQRESDDVTVAVLDEDGDVVRRLASGVPARPHRPLRLTWDGRTDAGGRAPDGIYRLQVNLRRQNRTVRARKRIRLDTEPPEPALDLVDRSQHVIAPGGGPIEVRVRRAGKRRIPRFRVWDMDADPPRQVAFFRGERGVSTATWDGRVEGGGAAPPGVYLIDAAAYDQAGNLGSSAPGLPERAPRETRGRSGVTVRGLAAAPPLAPVTAGRNATFFVDARGRPYRWELRRLGGTRILAEGRARRPRLVVDTPRQDSGVYLLQLRAGRFSTRVPFAVQSRRRHSILVVLPVITWLGVDRVDDDGDGLVDTLSAGSPVDRGGRVFRGDGGLPAGFAQDVAPLLVHLDRIGVPYDITTDLALDGSRDPRATDRKGVLLAGPLRWVSRSLARRLREYVEAGGRIASFGADTLRRGVAITPRRLVRPTQPSPADPFGARLNDLRQVRETAQLTPLPGTRAGDPLLTAWSGVLDGFTALEESEPPAPGDPEPTVALGEGLTEEEIAAAEEAGELAREVKPALTSTTLGEGFVIRVGIPQWVRRLADPNVYQLTRNLIDLLRRSEPRPRDPLR